MTESAAASAATDAPSAVSTLEHRHASWLELFYDLVYVVAVAFLAAGLSQGISLTGFAVFVGLFIPVWWSWAGQTIFASRFGRDTTFQRSLVLLQMVGAAAMAIQIPGATGAGSAGFAAAYVLTRSTLLVLYVRARGEYPEARRLSNAFLAGYGLGAGLWLVSIAVPPPFRFVLWAVGLAVEVGTFVLARGVSRRFPVHTSHMPERFGLFTIIVLGETVLAIFLGVADVNWNPVAVMAALIGFGLAVAIWWNYFGYVDRAPLQCTLGNGHAYTLFHLPMVLGIIAMGVGIEHIVVEASRADFSVSTLWLLGGGLGLWVGAFYGLQFVTYPPGEHRRLSTTYGLASLGILPAAFLGGSTNPIAVLVVLGLVMGALTYVEVQRRAAIPSRAYVTRADQRGRPEGGQVREYRGEGILIRYDPEVCVHAAECLRTLPDVFDLRNRPWVDAERAPLEEIIAAIKRCPTEALSFEILREGSKTESEE
ncbi:MAG: low temperature requirement protein A [Thermoplasmata archaeon]